MDGKGMQQQLDNGDAKAIEFTELERAQLAVAMAHINQRRAELQAVESQAQTLHMLIPQMQQGYNDLVDRFRQAHEAAGQLPPAAGAHATVGDATLTMIPMSARQHSQSEARAVGGAVCHPTPEAA